MLNTLFIGCAGAGSNVVEELKNKIEYNFVKYLTIDTSDANVKKDIPFRHIKKDTSDGSALAGSGGIRGKNYNDVQKGCIDFINDEKLHTFDGVIYLVFSSNGGSGNVIASVILKELLTKNIPVACLIVHDTAGILMLDARQLSLVKQRSTHPHHHTYECPGVSLNSPQLHLHPLQHG